MSRLRGTYRDWRRLLNKGGAQRAHPTERIFTMNAIMAKAREFLKSEDGPTTVEYAVMLALIVAVAIGTIALLGPKVKDAFQATADGMDAAGGGGGTGP